MIRDVNLINYLPLFIQEYREIAQIMFAENPEFQLTADESEIIKNNQFIQTCNLDGISKFEDILNIHPSNDDTLESRISRVMSRWNDVVPYTYKSLVQKLAQLSGNLNFNVNIDHNQYRIEVVTHLELPGQVDELQFFLGYMMPVNLELISSNEIYCNSDGQQYVAGTGAVICEVFELSDSHNEELSVQGSSIIGGSLIGLVEVTLSDNYNETININGSNNVGSNASVIEITSIN